ncbi:YidC/Oxa1 family membrane protein insertase [Patescibacteria group bacterium]
MIQAIHTTLLVNPIFNVLMVLYKFTGSLGFSIIGLTLLVKAISIPLILPSLKSAKKQRELQPQIDKLRKKYKHDKQKQAAKQMELLKQHGVNPASGCSSMIITILIFTALYSVIRQMVQAVDVTAINVHLYLDFIKLVSLEDINTKFLYLDLAVKDPYFIIAVLLGILQFIMAKMNIPYSKAGARAAKKTPDKKDDIAYNMQQQSLYMMPLMMVMLGANLPSGVALYIVVSTLFSIVQSYLINGWGGMKPIVDKIEKSLWKKA